MVQAETWKRHQDTVYWVDIQLAQREGLKFYRTRSNAIILYVTLPVYCIPKVVRMETAEIIYQKVYVSPQPPPKISFEDNRMKELGSEVAGSSKQGHPMNPTKTKTQLSGTRRPVGEQQFTWEIEKMSCLVALVPSTQQERRDPWMDQNPSRVACQCL